MGVAEALRRLVQDFVARVESKRGGNATVNRLPQRKKLTRAKLMHISFGCW